MVNCFIQIWSYNLRFIALQWMEQNIIKGWTCIIKVRLCVCVCCFLQEVSLHLWHCMTMSHGQRLTWPLGKATSFRLSITRKNQQSSASSSLSNATTSQKLTWADLYRFDRDCVQMCTWMNAVRAGNCGASLILSICWLKRSRMTLY